MCVALQYIYGRDERFASQENNKREDYGNWTTHDKKIQAASETTLQKQTLKQLFLAYWILNALSVYTFPGLWLHAVNHITYRKDKSPYTALQFKVTTDSVRSNVMPHANYQRMRNCHIKELDWKMKNTHRAADDLWNKNNIDIEAHYSRNEVPTLPMRAIRSGDASGNLANPRPRVHGH